MSEIITGILSAAVIIMVFLYVDLRRQIRELREDVNGMDIEIELNSVRDEMKEIKSKIT